MRIFVCEFITGGGVLGEPLPDALALEGDMMLNALISDLLDLTAIDIVTARDPRLDVVRHPIQVETPDQTGDCWQLWQTLARNADAVWPIAPETGGALEDLSEMAQRCHRTLLGSSPEAIRLTTSKSATSAQLLNCGIPAVETHQVSTDLPLSETGWIIKPDDGVGCEDTYLFRTYEALKTWLDNNKAKQFHVAQRYIPGIPASISMLCRDGEAKVLACNQQRVEINASKCCLRGMIVNGLRDKRALFEELADDVAKAIPGLWGYVGIDLILTPSGPVVLEVNPRLTTSYIGLRKSIRRNPAELVLSLLEGNKSISSALLSDEPVVINLEQTYVQ